MASDSQIKQFDDETQKLGQQLISLDKQSRLKELAFRITKWRHSRPPLTQMGRMLIEYKRKEALKQVIKSHNDDVQTICHLFSKEIGGSSPADGVPPKGLRNQLSNECTQVMTIYDLFVENNKARLNRPTNSRHSVN